MEKEHLEAWKSKLLEERGRIVRELEALGESTSATSKDASGDLSSHSSHMADQGTDAMEREKAFLFAGAKRRRVQEIDMALERVRTGSFGVCEICGLEIPAKRLESIPQASLCVVCQGEQEKTRGTRT